jgi:putative membrane protein insertion efficiency factor
MLRETATRLLAVLFGGVVRTWQLFLSPLFPGSCRFEPSCSCYAREAVALHGPLDGAWLTVRRIGRCHPWGGAGWDPVPDPTRKLACRAVRPG